MRVYMCVHGRACVYNVCNVYNVCAYIMNIIYNKFIQ
jgi:hypothetical protein